MSPRITARLAAILLCTALVAGCRAAPSSVTPTPAPTHPPASSPTVPPALAATASLTGPIAAPTPEAQPTFDLIVKGPFRKFTPNMGLPSGQLTGLWAAADGTVWLTAESGVYAGTQGFWQLLLDQPAVQVLGADAKDRVWVLLNEGKQIAYTDSTGWHTFGPDQGWAPLPELEYPSQGFISAPATDKLDQVWFATGRDDLRRIETKTSTWKTFTAADMGYERPDMLGYQGHMLTAAVTSSSGKVWVSDCVGEGELLTGQGIRRLDGDTWNPAPPTTGQCVFDMVVDSQDRIWVAAFDKVLRYDPLSGAWDTFPLPEGPRALVTRVQLDRVDTPWIEVARAGGASQFASVQRYHLDSSQWKLDDDPGAYLPGAFAFDLDNQAWLCSGGRVTLIGIAGVPLPYGWLDTSACQIAFDDSGQGWLLALGGPDEGLWYFSP